MLYLTTRDKHDTYTAPHAMRDNHAGNGGLFVPYRMPLLETAEIAALAGKSFAQTVADILNRFFSYGLTGWDIEFCIGRYPVKLITMNRKVQVAELWHNQSNTYAKLEKELVKRLDASDTSWLKIAIRIAVLFGVYGELRKADAVGEEAFDIALPVEDFTGVMSVWYARNMGLPIHTIICGCMESAQVWELLHLGEAHTDRMPAELERLICAGAGVEENLRFIDICSRGGVYAPSPEVMEKLRDGMFAAVVSGRRQESIFAGAYQTDGYVLSPDAALGFCALQDYRAKTGENRLSLLLSDDSPACHCQRIADAMGISQEKLLQRLNKS